MTTEKYDWDAIIAGLNQYLRLRSIPIGMKLYEDAAEMEAIPKIRRPKVKHTTDQIVAQARQQRRIMGQGVMGQGIGGQSVNQGWARPLPRGRSIGCVP